MGSNEAASFRVAVPVWLTGLEREMNVFAGFKAVFSGNPGEAYTLRIAASSIYRCWVNGKFIGHGPAAAAHGYYRIDEWALKGEADIANCEHGAAADTGNSDGTARKNAGDDRRRMVVAIEVAGYNVNSFYTLDQPSFVQAEIVGPDRLVVAATGGAAEEAGVAGGIVRFEAGELTERLRRTQRYSFQRAFSEAYRLSPTHAQWRIRAEAGFEHAGRLSVMEPKALLPRGFPYPCFDILHPSALVERGTVQYAGPPDPYRKDRSLTGIGPTYFGFREDELDTAPTLALQEYAISKRWTEERNWGPDESVELGESTYATFDYGRCTAGFIGAHVVCRERTRLYLLFDEVLTDDGKVDFLRLQGVNMVEYELQPGEYDLESLEPYTLRYLQAFVLEGETQVSGLFVREYVGSDIGVAAFASSDARLDAIFRAGIETYRHNAVDVFMDCPSRERAAWLCDSFFTARAAFDLSGRTQSEFHFLENFLLPERFRALPEGMLPMCYPADHYDGNFIPNWAMWFVLQLEEYGQRSGDEATIRAFSPRVTGIVDYFERFRNASGLLEKLDGWVFVEWSQANDWIGDVNYPTNMLYAGMLDAAARLYGRTEWAVQAGRVRQAIREQAYDGQFFVDHAVYVDGKLEVRPDKSEVCQYYGFYFGIADSTAHAELWRRLRDEFGPLRREGDCRYSDIPVTNQFIGNMLRLECLSSAGETDRIREEWPALFGSMVERTGTLWELDRPIASCDHGFVSHVVRVAYRDFLGIRELDARRRRIVLRPGSVALEACSGILPVGEDTLHIGWRWEEGTLVLETDIPHDYVIVVENDSGAAIRRVDSSGPEAS